jgi:hypothetical protein
MWLWIEWRGGGGFVKVSTVEELVAGTGWLFCFFCEW